MGDPFGPFCLRRAFIMRHFSSLAIALSAFLLPHVCRAQLTATPLISQTEAHRHGLQRAWMTHVSLDRTRDRLTNITLSGPHLMAQSDRSMLQLMDAENGGRVWAVQV